MTTQIPQHEKLFDEICNKLNELSHREDNTVNHQDKIDRMQGQIRKFQSELQGTQVDLNEKIRVLENVQFTQNDLNYQLKQVTDQLHNERAINTKLNTDLAKSLELCLQLQLEIQSLKARAHQIQVDERKYSQSLADKLTQLTRELELARALRDETDTELLKAKSTIEEMSKQIVIAADENKELLTANDELMKNLAEKDSQIDHLSVELEKISSSFSDVENSALKQNEVLNNLMQVAETKIVELKLALDKKNLECQDYYSHLQQALTQTSLLRQENHNLKDYIGKVNVYLQQQQSSSATQLPSVPTN